MAIVTGMGNEALFFPREDLDRLLQLPTAVSAVLVSATARLPAARGAKARRNDRRRREAPGRGARSWPLRGHTDQVAGDRARVRAPRR